MKEIYDLKRASCSKFGGEAECYAGKCDLVARQGDLAWVVDVKSGRPRAADQAQV